MRRVIRQGELPFEVKIDVPDEVTAAAIAEGREIMKDQNVPSYNSTEDLKAALDV